MIITYIPFFCSFEGEPSTITADADEKENVCDESKITITPVRMKSKKKTKEEDDVEDTLLKYLQESRDANNADMMFAKSIGFTLSTFAPVVKRQAKVRLLEVIHEFEKHNELLTSVSRGDSSDVMANVFSSEDV